MNVYILREWYITITVVFHHLAFGFVQALPAVTTPVITGNNTDLHATNEEAAWFVASWGFTIPVSFMLLPTLMQVYGRRAINIFSNIAIIVGSITIALAHDIIGLIIGRAIHGVAFAGVTLFCTVIAEYTHPERRGFFIIFKMSTIPVGLLICHSLGLKLTWRQLAWISTLPAALGLLGTFVWPESPAWLAYRGRFSECTKAFEYIRGTDLDSKKELKELIMAQQELQKTSIDYGVSLMSTLITLKSKMFLKLLFIQFLLASLFQISGCNFISAYIFEIMRNITGHQTTAYYFTMGFDIVQIFSVLLASLVIRYYKRRTILFSFGSLAYTILGLLCLSHYLQTLQIINLKLVTPSLLVLYQFICSLGVFPILIVMQCEIFPLKYRGLGSSLGGIIFGVLEVSISKISSNMLQSFDVHGTFSIYLIISLVLLISLYFHLPETKDKTLQNIENDIIDLKIDKQFEKEESASLVKPI